MDIETESTLSTFTATDGENLIVQEWPLPHPLAQRGTVIIVHGLGEHAGRYDHVARQLNQWGFAVRGYDQYGHGESAGPRGGLPSPRRLLDDLADLVDSTRYRMEPGTPLLLLGHSMGGLVAAHFVALGLRSVEGLILSSPALNPGLSAVQRVLLATVARWLPNLRVGNGLKPQFISHNTEVVNAYLSDPFVHDRICGRLARYIAHAGPAVIAAAPQWKVPTVLLYAGDDRLVSPQGSRDFAAAAPKDVVQSRCFERLYHEIFNERDVKQVFDALHDWIDARF